MERTPENGPIANSGHNGTRRPIGGIEIGSKFHDGEYVPMTSAEITEKLKEEARRNRKLTGGVKGSVFNGTEYIPIENLKP